MNQHRTWLLALVSLSLAVLACGFPLPLSEADLALWTQPTCGLDEPAASCEARQAAYQALLTADSVVVTEFESVFSLGEGRDIAIQGDYDYALLETAEGRVPALHGWLREVSSPLSPGLEEHTGAELIIIGTDIYNYSPAFDVWAKETLVDNTLWTLNMLLGVPSHVGEFPDMYLAEGAFTVESEEITDAAGQAVLVQTLTLDLEALFSDPDLMTALVDQMEPSLYAMGLDNPRRLITQATALLPYLEGTEVSTVLHIGQADGLLHYYQQTLHLVFDAEALDPEGTRLELAYVVSGVLHQEQPIEPIVAPTDYVEDAGSLLGSLDGLN